MKSVITAVILAAVTATSAIAGANTTLSPELVTLAMTGNPDAYAAKFGGTSNHKTGGTPGDFSYDVSETQLDLAKSALKANEFLAPHFAMNGGDVIVMVAPHLIIDGSVVKGIGPNDNFIVVRANGDVQRRDVSNEMGRDNVESASDQRKDSTTTMTVAATVVMEAAPVVMEAAPVVEEAAPVAETTTVVEDTAMETETQAGPSRDTGEVVDDI